MIKAANLYVDDDLSLRTVVKDYLDDEGYTVFCAANQREALVILEKESLDVILLDLTLPDADGLDILTRIRSTSQIPVIIMSGKSGTTERIIGIEMGADDYLTKPFDMREVMARIKAVLRRVPANASAPETAPELAVPVATEGESEIQFAGMRLDRNTFQAYAADGRSLNLTSGEFKLLEGLLLARNRVLTREQLFDLTREGDFLPFDRAIDIQISRIRKKIEDETSDKKLIHTVRGVGYMFSERQGS